MSALARRAADSRPGRSCPIEYRYSPRLFDRPAQLEATTLYVVGGLYGNLEALEALWALASAEPSPPAIVFNGDFHWFDVAPSDYARVNAAVLEGHTALRGNVETEIAGEDSGAGCGCAYPMDVSDAEVSRSNGILRGLRETARGDAPARARLAALPMHLVARVGDARVGIVHGDATSLAGWGFARDRLDDPAHARWVRSAFEHARVEVFASTHTCLPAMRRFGAALVANSGAAGMPNFEGDRSGLLTRVGVHPHDGPVAYGARAGGVHVEALPIRYDHERWMRRFLAAWPPGSAAHASYHRRMVSGAPGTIALARPR